jgi:hypothetical protein
VFKSRTCFDEETCGLKVSSIHTFSLLNKFNNYRVVLYVELDLCHCPQKLKENIKTVLLASQSQELRVASICRKQISWKIHS